MKTRKAQVSGTPAAAIILLIAAFILIYLVLIPAEDREELLGEENETVVRERQESSGILLEEQPGTITKLSNREFEHRIPSFNLAVKTEDQILKEVDSVFIESGGVSSKAVPFFVRDRAENGRLAFSVKDHSGRLTILFNGEQIFKGEVKDIIEPLALDNIEEENILEFSVDSPPGWQFWKKNHYDIRTLKVTATVENTENSEALSTFIMSPEEVDPENLADAYIIYLVDCGVTVAGKLTVSLNQRVLSSKVPDCSNLEKIDIHPDDFVEGRNELRFSAENGNYLLDRVSVKTRLRNPTFPVYFFYVNKAQFSKLSTDSINASVSLKFVDYDQRKKGVIDVNGRKISFDTLADGFSKRIDSFVREGSNSIRIEPAQTLDVTELKVKLDCREAKDCE